MVTLTGHLGSKYKVYVIYKVQSEKKKGCSVCLYLLPHQYSREPQWSEEGEQGDGDSWSQGVFGLMKGKKTLQNEPNSRIPLTVRVNLQRSGVPVSAVWEGRRTV